MKTIACRASLTLLLTIAPCFRALADSFVVAGAGGYQLSTTTGSSYDKQGTFTGGISGDAVSKTVTFGGNDTYSQPLGAIYGNHSFDYSATIFGQGTATFGALSGAISFIAQAIPDHVDSVNPCCGPINNDGHSSLSAAMQLTFNDSGVVSSASLPAGSPVTLHLT